MAAKDPSGSAQPTHVDGNGNLLAATIGVAYVSTPTGVTCATTTGTLAAATYYYRVTATTAGGETVPSTEVSFAAGATTGVAITWPQVAGATGYKVYGRSTGAELLMATITNGTTLTWTDAGSVTPSGAMPTVNTATGGAALDTTLAAMSAKLPAALGAALSAASLPVVLATDGVTIGATNEAIPATDATASGLNGGLKRIAARLTSIIALLPAALGAGGGLKVDGSGTALPVSGTVTANAGIGTLTDRSGTITAGGTAQTLAAANTARKYLLIQNLHATEVLWVNFTTAAVANQPSLQLAAAGGSLVMESSYVSTELVSVIAATTGHAFSAKEG